MKVNQYTQPLDLFATLRSGKLPASLRPTCDYSRLLAAELFPLLANIPQFQPWFDSMDVINTVAVYSGDAVPVINTREPLSRGEVNALMTAPLLVPSFMESLCVSLMNKTLPYEEVFAIVLDAMYTLNFKHYKTLGTTH